MESMILSAAEAASALKIKTDNMLKLLEAGQIPAIRMGRNWKVPVKALEAYVMERAEEEAKARREGRL